MSKDDATPQEGHRLPTTRGLFDGRWYYEEDARAVRLGFRVQERLWEERSAYQKITVYQTHFFGRVLTLDDVVMFTERDEFVYHEMLVHVPLCSLPQPRQVLIIGGGDCGCLREVLRHPSVERVVQCDIDPQVTDVSARYFDWVIAAQNDPRATVLFRDGVEYIRQNEGAFDLIVIDSTDPIGAAVGLFSADFYRAVARALKPGGVMTAQSESPHWHAGLVGDIYAQMRQAFSHVHPYLGFVPVYPSGAWSWAYAGNERQPFDHFNEAQAQSLEATCKYYNRGIHRAAFALPTFAQKAIAGENVYEALDQAQNQAAKTPGWS